MIAGQTEMEELLQREVAGVHMNVSQVVDQFLALASTVGELRCAMAGRHELRIEFPRHDHAFAIQSELARGRLRTMCARLAKLREESGEMFLPYGGEGTIRNLGSANGDTASGDTRQWTVRYMNTTDEHWFHITAQ